MTHATPYHTCGCGKTYPDRASWERLPLDGYNRDWIGNPDRPDDLEDPTHRVFEYRTCSCGSTRTVMLPFDVGTSILFFERVSLILVKVPFRSGQRLTVRETATMAHFSDGTWCTVSDLLAAIETGRVSVKLA